MDPAPGRLLVASPALTDANFVRSVIYLIEHSAQGTLGVIINRPIDMPLADIWSEVPEGLAQARTAAQGGPVEPDKGLLLHACADLDGAGTMGKGICVGGSIEALAERFRSGPDQQGPRLFLGHSGWSPGQLDNEIDEGGWIVRSGRPGQLFDPRPSPNLWQQLAEGRSVGLHDPSPN